MKVIRRLDNYNFVIAEELDEPKVREINGVEITYKYKNLDLYYPNIYWAIRGLIRKDNMKYDLDNIPRELEKLKPNNSQDTYMAFLEVPHTQIIEIIKKEYQC